MYKAINIKAKILHFTHLHVILFRIMTKIVNKKKIILVSVIAKKKRSLASVYIINAIEIYICVGQPCPLSKSTLK